MGIQGIKTPSRYSIACPSGKAIAKESRLVETSHPRDERRRKDRYTHGEAFGQWLRLTLWLLLWILVK